MKQMTQDRLEALCSELKQEFDESFREPLHDAPEVAYQELLAIRVAEDPYALRLSEVLGLHDAAHLTPVPSAVSEFLGLLGVRGLLVPVYDLGLLLGYGDRQASRWVALVRAAHPIGLAFSTIHGHFRVAASAARPEKARFGSHVREAVRLSAELHSLLDVRALVEALSTDAGRNGTKERDR